MSSISAGKLNSNALVHVGDRTGELVFKTNTTETALTIDSAQNAVFTGDVSVTGNLTINGTTTSFGDGDKLVLGDGDDFEIYHDGSNSYISDGGTGNLVIDTNGSLIKLASTQTDKTMATFNKDGSVELYHDNSQKLQTSSTGVTVTGTLDADNIPGTLGTEGQVLTVDAGGTSASWTDAGGGGSADFVASGAISNGDVVVLKSDGTINTISSSATEINPVTLGSTTAFNSADTSWTDSIYDPDSQKVIIAYRDNATTYPMAVVGTVSGTSITFGTPVVIQSVNSGKYMKITYDTTANKPVFFFAKYFSGQKETGQAVVGTVSGTSISFGTVADFAASSDPLVTFIDAAYDSGNNKHVIVWNNSVVTNRGSTAIVGTVSGTSITFGTPTIYNSSSQSTQWVVYSPSDAKVLVGYRAQDAANNTYVGTVSGTSISFGSPTSIATRTESTTGFYDPVSQKILVAYWDSSSGNMTGVTKVATISGTTVSYGSAVNFQNGDGGDYGEIAIAYSSVTESFLIAFSDFDASREIILRRGTISGSTASFETAVQTGLLQAASRMGLSYDTASGKFALLFGQDDAGDVGTGVVITETSITTDAADYFGVAAEDIDSAGTGSINIIGGINEGQTGLTVNTSYFVADDGSLTTTNNGRKIGRGIASTKLLVDNALTPAEMNAYLGGLV